MFPFEFDGDPDLLWKRWIVAANMPAMGMVLFFKPTSQVDYYDKEPSRLLGVVEYAAGEVNAFSERTIIPPDRFPIPYKDLLSHHAKGELVPKGILPSDFRDRMNQAVEQSEVLRKAQKVEFFRWFQKGESGD